MNKTEQEIEKIELEHRQIAENQKAYLPGYRQKIDRLLRCRDYTGLAEVLHSEKFLELCSSDTDMAYMVFCNQIYAEEQKTNPSHIIWENFHSVKDLLFHIQSLKFLLWRLEFGTDTGNELISCMKTHRISQTALKHMVQAFGMNKPELTERLIILFLDEDMTEYAFTMLEYADELNPGCEDILCMMAQICYESGRKRDASAYLDKIAEPTEITEKFRKLLFYE